MADTLEADYFKHEVNGTRDAPERFEVTIRQERDGYWSVIYRDRATWKELEAPMKYSTFARAVADVLSCTDRFELWD